MYIDSKFKPWLSLSTDAGRLSITGAYLDKEAGALICTDGKMLTRYPAHDHEQDEAGIIPPEALKEAAKLGKKAGGRAYFTIKDGKVSLGDGRSYPTIKMDYPQWRQVWPRFEAAPVRSTARLSLNPEMLDAIYQAYAGRVGVTLEFKLDDEFDAARGPILVTLNGGGGYEAVMMPIVCESRAPNRIDDADAAQAEYGGKPAQEAR